MQRLTVVRARIDGHGEFRNIIVRGWGSLGSANRARIVRVTHGELIVVLRKRLQTCGFDLEFVSWRSNGSRPLLTLIVQSISEEV